MFCKIIEIAGRQVLGRLDTCEESEGCKLQVTVVSNGMFGTVSLGPFRWEKGDEVLNLIFDEDKARSIIEKIDLLTGEDDLPRCGICGKPLTEADPKEEDAECGTCCGEHFPS